MITVTIQTIPINSDLHMETSSGCMTNRDFPRRDRRSWNGRRDNNSFRTSRRRRRNDVALMITVTIQTISINRDLHMETSRRRMADRDLSALKCRRRRSTSIGRSCRCGDGVQRKLLDRIRAAVSGRWDDVVNVITMAVETTSINVDLDKCSRSSCVTD